MTADCLLPVDNCQAEKSRAEQSRREAAPRGVAELQRWLGAGHRQRHSNARCVAHKAHYGEKVATRLGGSLSLPLPPLSPLRLRHCRKPKQIVRPLLLCCPPLIVVLVLVLCCCSCSYCCGKLISSRCRRRRRSRRQRQRSSRQQAAQSRHINQQHKTRSSGRKNK